VEDVIGFLRKSDPERSGGRAPQVERRASGKVAAGLVPASALKKPEREAIRIAFSRPVNIMAFFGSYLEVAVRSAPME
jgi:hypothetical protein